MGAATETDGHDHPSGKAPAAFKTHSPADVPAYGLVSAPTNAAVSANGNGATIVLVTGGAGFLASHLILQLLVTGYTVRATLSSLAQEADVRKCLATALAAAGKGEDVNCHLERLRFYAADLISDNGWPDAVRGCTYIHHVAAPDAPMDAKSGSEPSARDGVLRVLRAAYETTGGGSGGIGSPVVDRVILTSSFAAIGYGHPQESTRIFTELDWSIDNAALPAYHRSLLQAERAAWDYVQGLPVGSGRRGNKLQLTVINPVGIYGPTLGALPTSSLSVFQRLLDGSLSALPDLHLAMVDVRDLADLHVRAMIVSDEVASGQRFLAAANGRPVSLAGIALAIRKERPALAKARKVPSRNVPNWMVRAVSFVGAGNSRDMMPLLGPARATSNARARDQLGWRPRPVYETIMDTVDSLVTEEAAVQEK